MEALNHRPIVVEPVPVEEGQHLVQDVCPVLEVELEPSNVPGERLEGGGQREHRFVPAPGCPLERVVAEYEPLPRVTAHVELTPADRRGQELAQIDLVVDPVPDQLHLIGQVVLPDQGCQVEVPSGGGAGSGEPRRWRRRPRLEEEDVACFVGLDHGADHRRVVVDDGNRPVAGSGEGAQSLDLRGDDVTLVARLVHVQQARVELDSQVPAQGVQRAQRVGPHPLGATRVEPDEGGVCSWNQRITSSTPG